MTVASVLEVLITGDSRPLTAALGQATASTKAFAATTTSASRATASSSRFMTGGLGAVKLTAAGAGIALAIFAKNSFDAARSYDRAFGRIDAITNTSAERIGVMREEIMELSGETAQSPTELADAFYYLASAGLSVTEQNEALVASAQASAVGLGETADIARITSQALNVYAGSGLRAIDVVDALVAAVREGTAEPEQFADALGRVLPVASKAGIEFDQVTASLATMSNAGLDVHEGVTALRAVMQSLVAPTEQTTDALAAIGLTAEDVRKSLAEEGLIHTLRMLDERTHGNIDALRELIPNIRGMVGAFNLTEQEAAEVDRIFKEVANSSGDLAEAMRATAQNDAFRLEQGLQKIANAGQELASSVLPAVATAFEGLAGAINFVDDTLGDMPEVVEALKLALVALVAIKIVTYLQGWATASKAAAVANTALAASQVAVNTTATFQPGMIAGIRSGATAVAAAGANWAVAAGKATVLSRAIAGIGNAAGNLAPALGLLNAWRLGVEELRALKEGDFEGAMHAVFEGASMVIPGMPDLGATGAEAEEFKRRVEEVFGALERQVIGSTTAKDALHELSEQYGIALPNAIDRMVGKTAGYIGMEAAAKKAAMETNAALQATEDGLNATADAAGASSSQIAAAMGNLEGLASAVGMPLQGLKDTAMAAFIEDSETFGKAWRTMVGDMIEKTEEFGQAIAENVSFIGDEMTELMSGGPVTASGLLNALDDAAAKTRAYGADLLEVARIGQGEGAAFSQWIASLGTEGAEVANAVAGSSTKMQNALVSSFQRGQSAATRVADRMQREIVGTLQEIEGLLKALVTGDWTYILNMKGDGERKVKSVIGSLEYLVNRDWGFTVTGNMGIPPALDPRGGAAPPPTGRDRDRRERTVKIDRRRLDEELTYESQYAGFR